MLVNASNLDSLRVGFSAAFSNGMGQAPSQFERVATIIRATQKEQKYGWLGKIPNVREWIGARAVQNLMQHDYAIKEKPFELTIGVDKDDIETDNLGIYTPMFTEMGMSSGSKKDMLVFELLKAGFTTECYDGQNFFDTDHPVLDADGDEITVANTDGGAGTPWFLLDMSRALRPIILQVRKEFEFTAMTEPTSPNVFMNKEFIYGTDARMNVGFGFWQMAWGSRQTLNAANYANARASLMEMKGDYGRPLGINPRVLVVPPRLESAALKIVNNELGANGETNEWKGTAEVLVAPWLA
ncbi:MAG: Mu-like prophage major head subunit gpT family protein [Pseudotabrizicola sp.]|uniref:Mu-like prophage major head subunit gpT family protein n=1 Tax=Pseudotabrizicola sp. TaxID=2939647 RepID=UPI00271AE579|nr:Mu-like prophage major head subunit gpT family protein [Pseudotabrizicola sp.]MDO9639685.1 Mu-like prophage major head subunit gpT family protein [Pseudotabrizicola sp.]